MQVTRHRVFETNSSSTHSISIDGGVYTADKFPLEDGICKVHPGEFGWEEVTFRTPEVKASYCLVYVKTAVSDTREGKKQGEEFWQARTQMLIDVLKEETGCETVEFVSYPKDMSYEWGYIDHQSHIGDGDACGEAFESKKSLRDFIFNPKSFLSTDNDNH